MKEKGEGTHFDAEIGADGKVEIPRPVLDQLGARTGSRVRVHLVPAHVAEALEKYNVTAGELERIASVQLESEEQVIAFLLAEGMFSRAPDSRRGGGGRRK